MSGASGDAGVVGGRVSIKAEELSADLRRIGMAYAIEHAARLFHCGVCARVVIGVAHDAGVVQLCPEQGRIGVVQVAQDRQSPQIPRP